MLALSLIALLAPLHAQTTDDIGGVLEALSSETPECQPIIKDLDARFTIPGSLTPGAYEYVLSVGTESESSDPAFLVLPYTVRDDCGN